MAGGLKKRVVKARAAPQVETWPADAGPSRAEMIAGIRTLVAMGSCWLDRDPVCTVADRKQAATLRTVLASLDNAMAAQRRQTRLLTALLFRDELAIALGAPFLSDENGNRLIDREQQYAYLPHHVLGEWIGTSGMFLPTEPQVATDAVVVALQTGFFNFTLLAYRQPRSLSLEDARKYAEFARILAKDSYIGAMQAAGATVAKVLAEHDAENWKYANKTIWNPAVAFETENQKRAKTADTNFGRWLKNDRHPDRPQSMASDEPRVWYGPDSVDMGEFFGARRTSERSPNPRQRAAALLIADVCAGDASLAAQIEAADEGWPGLWPMAARGRLAANRAK